MEMHFPLADFFIWPRVVVSPPFPNIQNKTELYIYIEIHIENNIELNYITHLYTLKSCVYIHHTLYTSKFSHKL
jgi:hypothetical protein